MKRSRLRNIINKSKPIFNKEEIGNPFELFKKSLPIEIDDNYRLEAAWKAYGSPKNYKEALWQGMIQPIDENNVKLPSIGYNEETDEYEYLNSGKDNETVAKDIRVWDNDVIPLVQELKLGGYVRTFSEEKNCWTYSKNSLKRTEPSKDNELQVIDSFQQGGNFKLDTGEWVNNEYVIPDEQLTTLHPGAWDNYVKQWNEFFKNNPNRHKFVLRSKNGVLKHTLPMTMDLRENANLKQPTHVEEPSSIYVLKPIMFLEGGKTDKKEEINDNISLEDFINQKIQERTEAAIKKATTRKTGYKFKNKSWKNCIATATDNYGVPIVLRNSDLAADPKKYGFEELLFGDNTDTLPDGVLILDYNKPNDYTTPGHTIMLVGRTETGAPIYSYSSGSSDPSDMHNSTTKYFFDKWNDKVKPRAYRYIGTPAERAAWEEEYRAMYPEVESFKQGGQMNVIPEGALHARKNGMELAKEGEVTHKGIPVVDNDGNQQAEIERNEIIFNKEVTEKLENYYKQYNSNEKSQSEKDEIAIKAGKLLAKLIIENTDDRTGLIEEVANKQ